MTSGPRENRAVSFSCDDVRWMRLAVLYSARAQARTAENPAVGCVLVSKSGQLLSIGVTGRTGRPHAEQQALEKLFQEFGDYTVLQGGTAYVTLEPCAHHSQTGPCCEALIKAGVGRVIYGVGDPDSRVNGRGHARMHAAGLEVLSGLLAEEAEEVMAGFLMEKRHNRPFFTSKIALSSDGFIAASADKQTWLTGQIAKVYVHDLRSRNQALLTGINTVLADDPQLNCRLAGGQESQPACLVLDSHLRLPVKSKLVNQASQRDIIVIYRPDADSSRAQELQQAGVKLVACGHMKAGRPHPEFIAEYCLQSGWKSVLIEAGAEVNKAFFTAGLVDKVVELIAPSHLQDGYAGYSPSQKKGASLVFAPARDYIESSSALLGADRLKIWHPAPIDP